MTLEETRDVLKQLDNEIAQVVVFLVLTGVRIDEAADLLWTDIDFDNNLLTVTNNKTGKQRVVRLLPIVKRALLNRKQTQDEEKYVFGHKGKKDAALKQCIPHIQWKRAFKKLGLKVRKPEDLRKTFRTYHAQLPRSA